MNSYNIPIDDDPSFYYVTIDDEDAYKYKKSKKLFFPHRSPSNSTCFRFDYTDPNQF